MKRADNKMGRVSRDPRAKRGPELVQVCENGTASPSRRAPDQMDEIQCASERDLAIRNVDASIPCCVTWKAALCRITMAA